MFGKFLALVTNHIDLIMYMDEVLKVAMAEQQALLVQGCLELLILCMIKMAIMPEMAAQPQE